MKEKCLQELTLASKLKTVDIEALAKMSTLPNGLCELYNIRIQWEVDGSFIICSCRGSNFSNAVMGKIRSVIKETHPQLWEDTRYICRGMMIQQSLEETDCWTLGQ